MIRTHVAFAFACPFVVAALAACPAPPAQHGEGEGTAGEGEGANAGEGEGANAGEGEGGNAGEGEGANAGEGEGAAGEGEGAAGEGEGEGANIPPLSHDIGSCIVFPAYDGTRDDSWWNADVSDTTAFPTDANSAAYMNEIGLAVNVHPDFGSDPTFGIPFDVVPGTTPRVTMTFDDPQESDPGPYPFPPNAPVEAGSDAHVLVIDRDACVLYETGASSLDPTTGGWDAFSGAVFDLHNAGPLRPDDFTSADAAGLPIFPGLARVEEVQAGAINHALRFTLNNTQHAFVHPATHFASSITDTTVPPMGARLRLKASKCAGYLAGAGPQSTVIINALCHYGIILADNGSDMFISGATDPRWDDNDLDHLKTILSGDFEVVDTGPLITQ
jgi:hypothetical protein